LDHVQLLTYDVSGGARVRQVPKRSNLGVDLLRRLSAEGDRIFSTDRARELAPEVGLKDAYLSEALHHLNRTGWVVRLKRGLYAVSSSLPGVIPVHEFEIAMALVSPAAISHWSALHHHGLTEQAPRTTFVLTTTDTNLPRRSGSQATPSGRGYTVGDATFRFVQVRPERYFGVARVWVGDARVGITEPERTLLDGLMAPRLCGDFAEVLHAFDVRGSALDFERIVDYALRLDAATAKRLGWVLDHMAVESAPLERLAAIPIKGYRPLDPSRRRAGPRNRRWMVQENLAGRISS
jgi:predicted transcriptional regulator of viral defense system